MALGAAPRHDPAARGRILDTGWKLLVILASARAVEWAVRRLLAPRARAAVGPGARPTSRSRDAPTPPVPPPSRRRHRARAALSVAWRMLRRLPFVLAALLLDLVPVAVFAAVGHALLTTPLGATNNAAWSCWRWWTPT